MFLKQLMRLCLIWAIPCTLAFVAGPSPIRTGREFFTGLQALPSSKMPDCKPVIAAMATSLLIVPMSAIAQEEQVVSAATTVDDNVVLGLILGLVGVIVSTVVGFAVAYGALNKNDGRWGM